MRRALFAMQGVIPKESVNWRRVDEVRYLLPGMLLPSYLVYTCHTTIGYLLLYACPQKYFRHRSDCTHFSSLRNNQDQQTYLSVAAQTR